MVSTSEIWVAVWGWVSSLKAASNSRKRAADSSFRTTDWASSPWRVLLRDEFRLPCSFMGPRERAPLVLDAWCLRYKLLSGGGFPGTAVDRSRLPAESRFKTKKSGYDDRALARSSTPNRSLELWVCRISFTSNIPELLKDHITLEVECMDRMDTADHWY